MPPTVPPLFYPTLHVQSTVLLWLVMRLYIFSRSAESTRERRPHPVGRPGGGGTSACAPAQRRSWREGGAGRRGPPHLSWAARTAAADSGGNSPEKAGGRAVGAAAATDTAWPGAPAAADHPLALLQQPDAKQPVLELPPCLHPQPQTSAHPRWLRYTGTSTVGAPPTPHAMLAGGGPSPFHSTSRLAPPSPSRRASSCGPPRRHRRSGQGGSAQTPPPSPPTTPPLPSPPSPLPPPPGA